MSCLLEYSSATANDSCILLYKKTFHEANRSIQNKLDPIASFVYQTADNCSNSLIPASLPKIIKFIIIKYLNIKYLNVNEKLFAGRLQLRGPIMISLPQCDKFNACLRLHLTERCARLFGGTLSFFCFKALLRGKECGALSI